MHNSISEKALNVLYPRRCPACHEISTPRGALICDDCRPSFSRVKQPFCLRCGKEIGLANRELCYDCAARPKKFEQCVSLFNYNDTARESMAYFKYRGRQEYADYYIEEMLRSYGDTLRRMQLQLILPVPVHRTRLLERGYNQAELLAKRLGQALEVPVVTDLLVRNKQTQAQKKLNPAAREQNLADAFACTGDLKGIDRLLLVDDIYTTGSTLSACAGVLKAAGAKKVFCCTVCTGRDS